MNKELTDHLSNREKNLVSMGAAMGAGCRTCADKLYELAVAMKIPEKDMLAVFNMGLEAKAEAVETMRVKVSTLLKEVDERAVSDAGGCSERLASLVRMASFLAANSAPDALAEIRKAKALGVSREQIQLCISLAKMVRKNAQAFSDQDIADQVPESDGGGEMCCPVGANAKSAAACSCG